MIFKALHVVSYLFLFSVLTEHPLLGQSPKKLVDSNSHYRGLGLSSKLLPLLFDNSKNLVFSPFGIEASLVYLGIGASGETRAQIFDLIDVRNTVKDVKQRRIDLRGLSRSSPLFSSFSGIATGVGGLNPNYKETLSKDLGSEFFKLTLDSINTWAMGCEAGKFGYPLGFLSPSASTLVFSLNNIDLQIEDATGGGLTTKEPFYVARDLLSAVLYSQVQAQAVLLHADGFSCLSFSVDESSSQLYIFIPTPQSSLDELVGRVSLGFLESIFKELDSMMPRRLKFLFPVINARSSLSLGAKLSSLGLSNTFSSQDAEFPKISSNSFYIDDLHQVARVSIEPKATDDPVLEAPGLSSKLARAIIGDIGKLSVKQVPILDTSAIEINRPFLFFVLDKETKFVLVAGSIINPVLTH